MAALYKVEVIEGLVDFVFHAPQHPFASIFKVKQKICGKLGRGIG